MTFLFLKNEHPVVPTLKIYEFVPKVVKALSPFHTNHGRPNTMKVTAHIINFNKLHYASCFWVKFSSSTFPCAGVSVCSWNQNSTPNESESALERVNMRLRWVSPLLARPQIEDFSPPPPLHCHDKSGNRWAEPSFPQTSGIGRHIWDFGWPCLPVLGAQVGLVKSSGFLITRVGLAKDYLRLARSILRLYSTPWWKCHS